jgi:hypothetical protein
MDRPRVGVVVTGEPHYLANSAWMRELLRPAPFPTLVASLRDVEHLMALPIEEIAAQLVSIVSDPEKSTFNLSLALDLAKGIQNPVLEGAWNEYPWLDDLATEHSDGDASGDLA